MSGGDMYSYDLLQALFRNNTSDLFYLWTAGDKRPKDLPIFEEYPHVKWVHTRISHKALDFYNSVFSFPYIDDIVETQAMKDGQLPWVSQIDAAVFLLPTNAPIERNCLKVYVCHSLAPIHYPSICRAEKKKLYSKSNYKKAIESADLVFTPSEFLKDDLLDIFAKKIESKHVIPLGCGVLEDYGVEVEMPQEKVLEKELFKDKEEQEQEDITHSLPDNFFFVRGINPYFGNISSLLKAYELFRSRFAQNSWSLVIEEELKGDLQEFFADIPGVKVLPPLSDKERAAVLKQSQCFLYLSLYDMTGTALVEAMRQETVIISSTFGALPEVYHESVLECDPTAYLSILRAMKKVFREEDVTAELIEKAKDRSYHSRFRFDDIAHHMMHSIAERIEEKEEEQD